MAYAIVLAVNHWQNLMSKGINPEGVEGLVNALHEVLGYEKRGAEKGEPRIGNGILSIIHKALTAAKLQP